jgi:prephenate dehydratase
VEWQKRKDYDAALSELLRQVKNLSILGEYKKARIEYR